ncbi:CDIF630_02480 family spore surface protein [Clostridioides sp. ZZV14-6044]|uniref:CDIF630_02480 family spore surface protein n=1 Tax=unclassified Clostridioides TaxID=2635829 RepID=UPI0039B84CFB
MIVLESKKARALKGKDNKRLRSPLLVGNESTAAWADVEKLKPHSKVSIPSLNSVEEAKDWVDNGSKL